MTEAVHADSVMIASQQTLREAMRRVLGRTRLVLPDQPEGRAFVLGVTSPRRGEGRTTLAMGLASTLADEQDRPVTLVDLDFVSPSLGDSYALGDAPGIGEVVSGREDLDAVMRRVPPGELRVIPAGRHAAEVNRLAGTRAFAQRLEELRARGGYVVVDLPAVLSASIAPVLARTCDGVVMVARGRKTTTGDIEEALSLLGGVRVLGVVVNRRRSLVPRWLASRLALAG